MSGGLLPFSRILTRTRRFGPPAQNASGPAIVTTSSDLPSIWVGAKRPMFPPRSGKMSCLAVVKVALPPALVGMVVGTVGMGVVSPLIGVVLGGGGSFGVAVPL